MPETLTIACPACGKQITAPADVAGKKIRCKGCGGVFVAKAGPAKAAKPAAKPAAAEEPDDLMGDGKPYGITTEKLGHRCPECANAMESEDAIVCLKCGYNTRTRQRMEKKRVADITGGDYFLHLLPGFLCVFVLLWLLTWNIVYLLMADRWFPKEGSWSDQVMGSGFFKLWSTIISLYLIYLSGKFAFKRLILNPKPPEHEIRG